MSSPLPKPTGIVSGARSGLPFEAVRSALAANRDPVTGTAGAISLNAETNIITALICHADGGRPGSVCRRGAIKQILKHVR
jgi:hypothetical protein